MSDTFNDEDVAGILKGWKNDLPELSRESLALNENQSEKALNTFQSLLQKFNETHNLNLKINFSDLFANLSILQEGNNLHVMELYLSETWNSFRVIFFMRVLQCLVVLADKIASPERLGDMSTPLEQDYASIDRLFGYIDKITSLGRDIGIFDINAEVTRIHRLEESQNGGLDRTNPEVAKLLDALGKSLGYGNQDSSK